MPAPRWILSVLVALILWPALAHGQSPQFKDAYERFQTLYDQGRYQDALPFAEEALRLGQQEFGPGHQNTAVLLNNLAGIYQAQGKYDKAEPLYRRALGIREAALGPDNPAVARSLENYAAVLREIGRSAKAAELEARAKAIRDKHARKNR